MNFDDVPNMDGMWEDDLLDWWLDYRKPSRSKVAELVGSYSPRAARIVRSLARYAYWKSHAMRARLRGDITLAVQRENICERIYQSLPRRARW